MRYRRNDQSEIVHSPCPHAERGSKGIQNLWKSILTMAFNLEVRNMRCARGSAVCSCSVFTCVAGIVLIPMTVQAAVTFSVGGDFSPATPDLWKSNTDGYIGSLSKTTYSAGTGSVTVDSEAPLHRKTAIWASCSVRRARQRWTAAAPRGPTVRNSTSARTAREHCA